MPNAGKLGQTLQPHRHLGGAERLWSVIVAMNEPQSLELSSDDVASFLKVMGWFEEQKGQCFPGETMLTPQQMAEALRVIGVVFAELKQGPPPKPKRKIR